MSHKNQQFDSFEECVADASVWLTDHPDYNDTEHGKEGFRGKHFKAICFDSIGRRCSNGADFMRARDERTFPVHWLWPDQVGPLFLAASHVQYNISQARMMHTHIGKDHYIEGAIEVMKRFGFNDVGVWSRPSVEIQETFK